MPKRQVWLIAALILAAAFVGGITSSSISLITGVEAQRNSTAAKPAARKYEYQAYVAPGPKDLSDQANRLADEGWELVDVITDERVVIRYVGFFRRPK
ncbi:MAG TPA: hypothetical protein VN256_21775 [Pyrinomonadaceae bacterium]|nr:hypothetical protein [Pyrinomonadaceae bacterium]